MELKKDPMMGKSLANNKNAQRGAEKKDHNLNIRTTWGEKNLWRETADEEDLSLAAWVCQTLNNQCAKKEKPTKYTVTSLFSGCGGMDLGFIGGFGFLKNRYKKLGFDISWANEISEKACDTYRHNIGGSIINGDIWDHIKDTPEYTDVVIGGFPCQDISINGKREGIKGKKSSLYLAMVEVVRKVKPAIFIAENVKGLLMEYNKKSLKKVIKDFESLGYNVNYELFNSADYGVPQTRERVFIVGTLKENAKFEFNKTREKVDWVKSSVAINDLEGLEENKSFNHIWSRAKKSADQGSRKIKEDRPSTTIRAECHGNIQFHYKLDRRLSMREAARFQSFPDNFIFQSNLRETERQIGNAVPPVLAWHIASDVKDYLDSLMLSK